MSDYYVKYRASVQPIELVSFTDTNDKQNIINYDLNRFYGGGLSKQFGTTATTIGYGEYTFTNDTPVALSSMSLSIIPSTLTFLFAMIDTGANLQISLDGTNYYVLVSENESGTLLRLNDIDSSVIRLKSTDNSIIKILIAG